MEDIVSALTKNASPVRVKLYVEWDDGSEIGQWVDIPADASLNADDAIAAAVIHALKHMGRATTRNHPVDRSLPE